MRHRMSNEDRKHHVRLHITNDFDLYQFACWCIEANDCYSDATRQFLRAYGNEYTTEGVAYTYETVHAALLDIEESIVAAHLAHA